MMLTPGTPLTWWQVTALTEREYDVADAPMAGEMDSTFFLTKDKNIIPHTYPCRTAYIGEARGVEPVPAFAPDWAGARNVLPIEPSSRIYQRASISRVSSVSMPAPPSKLWPPTAYIRSSPWPPRVSVAP